MKHFAIASAVFAAVLLLPFAALGQSVVAGPLYRKATAFAVSGPGLLTVRADEAAELLLVVSAS